ncbi:MAG: AAA family ATPase [Myxococcales bacterium]|nr:AAA family ATPase [Myxococcales bacterium]
MDEIQNPFSPGAGSPPPELVGRDDVLNQARILFGRIKAGKSERSILLTGLRGVGKTVLLNEMKRMAEAQAFHTISIEAHENKTLASLLAPHLRTLLYDIDRIAGAGDKVRRGLVALKGFLNGLKVKTDNIEIGLDIDAEKGTADSGDLEIDLPNLFVTVADAAVERKAHVCLLIDEIQYFNKRELSALIMALHKMQQQQLPFVLLGAGLPVLPGLAGESKSYAERLFSFPDIGALSKSDAIKALQDPVTKHDVLFRDDALEEIYRLTQGYPYFLQEWGYQAWNRATASPIGLDLIKETTEIVSARLDENFFRVRFGRLTPGEKRFLRAMAELGSGPQRTSDIAEVMSVKITSLGPTRAKLLKKGMVYSPSHGDMAFTVPLFDKFMKRSMPTLD